MNKLLPTFFLRNKLFSSRPKKRRLVFLSCRALFVGFLALAFVDRTFAQTLPADSKTSSTTRSNSNVGGFERLLDDSPLQTRFAGDRSKNAYKNKKIVLISGDEEYRSEEMATQWAKILAFRHGFDCVVLYAINKETGRIDPATQDNIPGLIELRNADLAVFFTRFRNLPDEQMKEIDDYLRSERPVLGVRTATHAFAIPQNRTFSHYSFDYQGTDDRSDWNQGFGRKILGETWVGHHGNHGVEATRGLEPSGTQGPKHSILNGCDFIFCPTDVYSVRTPLPGDARPLLFGLVLEGTNPNDRPVQNEKNDPPLPIAWIKTYRYHNDDSPDDSLDKSVPNSAVAGDELDDDQKTNAVINNANINIGAIVATTEKISNVETVSPPDETSLDGSTPTRGGGKVFVSTAGGGEDFECEDFRRLLVNAVYWLTDLEDQIPEQADVRLVGEYRPNKMGFGLFKKEIKPTDWQMSPPSSVAEKF